MPAHTTGKKPKASRSSSMKEKRPHFSGLRLNPRQEAAAQAPRDPLLIVAGAGTGKTLTLTTRLANFVESGVPLREICALTFTNKAAQEMRERAAAMLRDRAPHALPLLYDAARGPFIGTLHSFGAMVLRRECRAFGRNSRFSIFDDDDTFGLIRKIMKIHFKDGKKYAPADAAHHISARKNGIPDASRTPLAPTDEAALGSLFDRYEMSLQENNAFDFDDLIQKTVSLFETSPALRAAYARRYPHLFVDEYQDLNNTQYALLKLLARREGMQGSFTAVGDDQQMIYGWRGSNLNIFLGFENEWPRTQTLFLEENYRSTATIIKAAGEVIKHNRYQKPKTLWTKNTEGDPIVVVEAGDEDEEAEWVASQIKTTTMAQSDGAGENASDHRDGRHTTIAVLYRTNAQSRAVEQSLIAEEIPYRIFGGVRFYERREIKDVIAALRLASNPRDTLSFERLKKNLLKSSFLGLLENIKERRESERNPAALIRAFLKEADYFAYLQKNFENPAERQENILGLLRFAETFGRVDEFLERVALLEAHDDAKNPSRTQERAHTPLVSLMTIHLAKGLEFDHVFVIGAAEGLLPHARSTENEHELEEERRLLYVAMTRAKKKLAISFYEIPSRFVSEIPEECFSFTSLVSGEDRLIDREERYITLD